MEKRELPKEKSNLKSGVLTGTSSAVGATIGIVAGEALASEVNAAEIPEEETDTVHAGGHQSSSAHSQGEAAPEAEPTATGPAQVETPPSDEHDHGDQVPPSDDDMPEISVLGYETVINDDGSQSDVAVISIDGQEAQLIDSNQDGNADMLMVDVDGNGDIDSDEILNIEDEGISMSGFQTDVLGDSHSLVADADYINDANVDDYMA